MSRTKFDDIWHLAWIYNRLIKVHKESSNTDYMETLRHIIHRQLLNLDIPIEANQIDLESGLIEFKFSKEQP